MKTRTLLLLSVGTALMILIAGGVLLFQLSNEQATTAPTPLGTALRIGDAEITVFGSTVVGDVLSVDVLVGGVDDPDGVESFGLVTGDRRLSPMVASAEGRCGALTIEPLRCSIDFDVSATEGSSRVLTVRRGEEGANWRLR